MQLASFVQHLRIIQLLKTVREGISGAWSLSTVVLIERSLDTPTAYSRFSLIAFAVGNMKYQYSSNNN